MNYFCVSVYVSLVSAGVPSLCPVAMKLYLTPATSFDDAFLRVEQFLAEAASNPSLSFEACRAFEIIDVFESELSVLSPIEIYAFRMSDETTATSLALETVCNSETVMGHCPLMPIVERYYGVSVVEYFKYTDGNQTDYPIWMNIYLTPGTSRFDAVLRACAYANLLACSGGVTCDDRPVEQIIAGARAIYEISDDAASRLSVRKPIEAYSFPMEVSCDEELRKLCDGRPLRLDDQVELE